jgi:hypothetical protein
VDAPQYRIVIEGLSEDIKALERYAPDLKRELDKEVKGVLRPIVQQAKDYIPDTVHPSGWNKGGTERFTGIGPLTQNQTRGFVAFDAGKARQGIKQTAATSKKNGNGFRNTYAVVQRDPAGAIFETAGRGSARSRMRSAASRSRNPFASQQFIGVIQREHGTLPTATGQGKDKGRAIIRAVDENRRQVFNSVKDAIKKASQKAQTRMDETLSNREMR